MIRLINKGCIYYLSEEVCYVNDYYQYVVSLFIRLLKDKDLPINIIIGDHHITFPNKNKVVRVHINYEHTLVKQGGRDTYNTPVGNIKVENAPDERYLVRINNTEQINRADIVVDYSIPNILNINQSKIYDIMFDKCIYIAPVLYEPYFVKSGRTINTLTTFINTNEPRRLRLLSNVNSTYKWNHQNINNCFDKNELCRLYRSTKIMINIHQTDHHHTFEELRVLPALLSGVLVVCEDSPLREFIPYHDYIIWSSYDGILERVDEVLDNYDQYFENIFGNGKKRVKLGDLDRLNHMDLQRKIV